MQEDKVDHGNEVYLRTSSIWSIGEADWNVKNQQDPRSLDQNYRQDDARKKYPAKILGGSTYVTTKNVS